MRPHQTDVPTLICLHPHAPPPSNHGAGDGGPALKGSGGDGGGPSSLYGSGNGARSEEQKRELEQVAADLRALDDKVASHLGESHRVGCGCAGEGGEQCGRGG